MKHNTYNLNWLLNKVEKKESVKYLFFWGHANLKEFLLNTKDRIIVEASLVANIWGIGIAQDNDHAENPRLWKGSNLLGFALMEVRDRLKKEE